ncbi:SAM-dependent methyltransferase [Microbacterium sp. P01]|uniref:SAM-dependent methyltransferase n=1 Tax=Microbacterium sp. P01 TaxID=3366261 RepID=UPI0036712DC9
MDAHTDTRGDTASPDAGGPPSMSEGSAGAKSALVAEDAAHAVAAQRTADRNREWESRYSSAGTVWSGHVNSTVAILVAPLAPGTVLDIGCGEGGDAIWFADHGWRVTGIDVSATAVGRASAAARERGIDDDRARFVVMDATREMPEARFDLVTASFLHSSEHDFPRIEVLRAAAARVAPGGRLVIVSHVAQAGSDAHDHGPVLRTPDEELETLGLRAPEWVAEAVDVRPRADVVAADAHGHLEDGIIVVRRVA